MNLQSGDVEALLAQLSANPPGFGMRDPEVQSIMMAVLRMDNRVRPLKLHRFSYPSYVEPGRERFNINRIPDSNLYMSEGPEPDTRHEHDRHPLEPAQKLNQAPAESSAAIIRFLDNTVFHPDEPIQRVIVAGDPHEGAGFEDYFTSARSYAPQYTVHLEAGRPPSPHHHIAHWKLKVEKLPGSTGGEVRDLEVFQLTQMPDFGVPVLTEADLLLLQRIFVELPQTRTNIHCAAGLGRTGLLSLAWTLWRDFGELMALPDAHQRSEWVLERLSRLRKVRPGVVQTLPQLREAVRLANTLHSEFPQPSHTAH